MLSAPFLFLILFSDGLAFSGTWPDRSQKASILPLGRQRHLPFRQSLCLMHCILGGTLQPGNLFGSVGWLYTLLYQSQVFFWLSCTSWSSIARTWVPLNASCWWDPLGELTWSVSLGMRWISVGWRPCKNVKMQMIMRKGVIQGKSQTERELMAHA